MESLLSDEECTLILKRSLKHDHCKLVEKELSKFANRILGFMGDHLVLNLKYTVRNDPAIYTGSFFVKCLPQTNQEQKEFVDNTGMLRKEVKLYKKLMKPLQALVTMQFCAELYFSRENIMVFENLESRGFAILPKTFFDKWKIMVGLRTMAQMHGASLILEDAKKSDDNDYFLDTECKEELSDYKFDYTEGHERNNWVKAAVGCVGELCVYFTGDFLYKQKVRHYLESVMPKVIESFRDTKKVLCHNDLWANNLMFNENDECIFVDFQLAKYGPPAFDFWVFLYFNAHHQLLQDNLNEFLEHYFDSLKSELETASLEISLIISKQDFLDTVKFYQKPALFQVNFCGTYIYASDEFIKKMINDLELYDDFNFGNRSRYILEEITRSKECEERFKNTILPLCDMFR
ncbi:uncharacterized protein [Euwallacea similis]|uniref:uncharacterized protein n=1 Tax=Euwallacea similis TaxID=1736056 RepID=UPI00344DFE1E